MSRPGQVPRDGDTNIFEVDTRSMGTSAGDMGSLFLWLDYPFAVRPLTISHSVSQNVFVSLVSLKVFLKLF